MCESIRNIFFFYLFFPPTEQTEKLSAYPHSPHANNRTQPGSKKLKPHVDLTRPQQKERSEKDRFIITKGGKVIGNEEAGRAEAEAAERPEAVLMKFGYEKTGLTWLFMHS